MIVFFFSYVLHYRPQTKLREGNVFTPVYHSVHSGVGFPARITGHMARGGLHPGGVCIQGFCIQGGLPTWRDEQTPPPVRTGKAGGAHPTGMLCSYYKDHVNGHAINLHANLLNKHHLGEI